MPYLKINACIDCPYHGNDNSIAYGMDDMFGIRCDHPDQTDNEPFLAKIKNKENHIYFNCPLYKIQEESEELCTYCGGELDTESEIENGLCVYCDGTIIE